MFRSVKISARHDSTPPMKGYKREIQGFLPKTVFDLSLGYTAIE